MKKLLIALILLAIIGYFGYNYVMAPPKNISESSADFKITAVDFSKEFSTNLESANTKYQEKIIRIDGTITEVESEGVTINKTIFCKLDNMESLNVGDQIKIKGLYIGYDDLFELVKLDQCTVVK
jgi:pectate lyase